MKSNFQRKPPQRRYFCFVVANENCINIITVNEKQIGIGAVLQIGENLQRIIFI